MTNLGKKSRASPFGFRRVDAKAEKNERSIRTAEWFVGNRRRRKRRWRGSDEWRSGSPG